MRTIESITKELAAELDGWEYTESKYGDPRLVAQNGASIWCKTVNYHPKHEAIDADRLRFHVGWPEATVKRPKTIHTERFYPYDGTFTITCAASRAAASIAKDVKRRLIRRYLPKYAEMLERKAEYLDRVDRTNANAKRIADALGVDYEEGMQIVRAHGDVWSKFEVDDDEVVIDLSSVPVDLALIIAEAVRDASRHRGQKETLA